MHTNILSWIRKRQLTLNLFVAVMVNLMVFSQPLNYAINYRNIINRAYFKSGGDFQNTKNEDGINQSYFGNIEDRVNINPIENEIEPSNSNTDQTTGTKVTTKNTPIALEDADVIPAFEKQGIIGKSENLPIDELTDNIFSFDLKENFKQNKEAYLEYELFGLADGSQTTKSINDQLATGGSIIKTTKTWTKVRERLNPSDIQIGKNFVKFTTVENGNYQYMVRNLKMVYEDRKNSNSESIVFNQPETNSYNGKIAFSGFVKDKNVSKVSVLGNGYPVINGVFEVLLEEKEPNGHLVVTYIDAKGIKNESSNKINQLLEKPTSVNKNSKTIAIANKIFEKGKSNTLSFAGASLQVEDLSLTETKNISIAGLRYVDLPTLSPEMVNVTGDYYGYRMLPHGNHFTGKPAKIHLKYDEKKFPTGYTAKDVKTFYFDNEQRKWLALEKDTLLSTAQEIVSKTTHFTDFINGIIKVPESPETGSYTPTSIKDIKAADPTAGVVSIAPPSPNNMGTLNTSFPIKLPAGRSGMQPELSVNYNSEGGNGWMGLGWDLSVPGVSLETRWGAPRYDGTYETEIYSMGGGMLTLDAANPNGGTNTPDYTNPHREDNIARNTNNQRQFYPRIEGSYAQVIRHGSSPANYWWEVTDKTGNKSFYGGYAGAIINNAVIKTATGNIAYWGLYRTEDTNGNYVEYIYDNQAAALSGQPGDGGNEFYIKEIKYTLHSAAQNNFYKVSFNRTNNYTVGTPSTYNQRKDIQVNARNGVVQVTKDLLKEIKVSLEQSGASQTIRTYRFDYEEHAFFKQQLVKVAEYDTNNELFYSNTMEYEDEVRDASGNYEPFAPSVDWSIQNDSVGEPFAGIDLFKGKYTAINGSKSSSFSGNFRIGVGFANDAGSFKLNSVGIHGNFGRSNSQTMISLQDMDGDGLPDKVFNENGTIKYRPNLSSPLGQNSASFGNSIEISTISNLGKTKTNSTSLGIDASYGVSDSGITVGAGFDHEWSNSTIKNYFLDVNGDGIADFVENGNVKFWKKDAILGTLKFENGSSQTPNPIKNTNSLGSSFFPPADPALISELETKNPLLDVVRVWVAPRNGTIQINSSYQLLPVTVANGYTQEQVDERANYINPDNGFDKADGVHLFIQYKNSTTNLWNQVVGSNDLSTHTTPIQTVNNVLKGDKIYFRASSIYDGNYDKMDWNPVITYTTNPNPLVDASNKDLKNFNASNEFVTSSDVFYPVTGNVNISGSFQKSNTSDDITFSILECDATGNIIGTIAGSQTVFVAATSYNLPINFTYNFGATQRFVKVLFHSDSDVNWKDVSITNLKISTSTEDTFVSHKKSLYNKKTGTTGLDYNRILTPTVATYARLTPSLVATIPSSINGDFVITAKQNNKLIAKTRASFVNSSLSFTQVTPLQVPVANTSPVYVEISVLNSNTNLLQVLSSTSLRVTYASYNSSNAVISNVNITNLFPFYNEYNDLGLMYRNWGGFAVNGNTIANSNSNPSLRVINESNLHDSNDFTSAPPANYDPNNPPAGGATFDIANQYFYRMSSILYSLKSTPNLANTDINRNCWAATDIDNNIFNSAVSVSRLGEDDIKQYYQNQALPTYSNVPQCGDSFSVLLKTSKTISNSINAEVGSAPGNPLTASGSASHTLPNDHTREFAQTDMMDFNGDNFPDFVSKEKVKFTNSLGGISNTQINLLSDNLTLSKSIAFALSTSGGYAHGDPASGWAYEVRSADSNESCQSSIKSNKEAKANPNKLSISGNYSRNNNEVQYSYFDVNGDGLPDKLDSSGNVQLNLGYGFENNTKNWSYGSINKSNSDGFGAGLGFSIKQGSFSAGLNYTRTETEVEEELQDINGDGLLDKLTYLQGGNISVEINTGNKIEQNLPYNSVGDENKHQSISTSKGGSINASVEINFVPVNVRLIISGGAGGSLGVNRVKNSFIDINGDGYVDYVESDENNELKVRLSKIGKTHLLKKVNTPTGGSWEVAYERVGNTYELPQSKFIVTKIKSFDAFTADNSWSNDRNITSVKYEKPHHDRREREFFGFGKLTVNQHGGFNTDIDLNNASAALPPVYRYSVQEFHNDNYYLKGAVKKESLFDANNVLWTESKTTYGIYKPETTLAVADTRPAGFNDTNSANSINADVVTYGTGVTHVSANTNFICTDLDASRLFVTPLVSLKSFTEGGTGLKTAVTVMEGFDAKGNITQYRDYGEQSADVYVSKMTYYPSVSGVDNGVGFPEYIRVYQANGTTLQRERKATYNTHGDLEKVITTLNTTENASVKMSYDTYGNLSKVTHENSVDANGNQFFREYTYDDVLYTYPVAVNDAFGYSSSSVYNYLFGIPVYTTDMNSQPMRTRIDDRGRPIEITGPYELFVEGVTGGSDVGWTIRFEYQNETPVATKVNGTSIDDDNYTKIYNANNRFEPVASATALAKGTPHRALTRHFDPEYRSSADEVTTSNQILTSTLADGFGKPVQVKKMFSRHIAVTAGNTPNTTNNTIEWLLAGKVKQDAFGRAIESYYPTTQTDNFAGLTANVSFVPANAFVYDNNADTVAPTTATYDVLDRSLTTNLPGESEKTTMAYTIDSNRFLTTVTNEKGQVQKSFTDVRGRTTQTLQESLTGNIPTNFEYNNLGELLKVTDVANNLTESKYDLAGRRIELRHPDNGITQLVYDKASNLIERKTANLLQAGQKIEYKYTYNRLDEIRYPQNPENNVHYYYGTAGNSDAANDNAVGRLWYHVDATGTQYMKYGRLGELTLNRRSVAVPGDRVYWFQTEWTYDTWNRVKTIKYPDQELVTYKYNKGGELHAMTSEKNGTPNKDIISQLGYDKFGQRTYLRYGNGTETTYDYEAERRRLDRMKVSASTTYGAATARQFVNNKYNYDVLSNVESIENNLVTVPTATQIGGRSLQAYTYDDLNRLTTATGNFVGRNDNGVGFNHSKYTLAMGYDSQHNITSKIQMHETATSTSAASVAGPWTQVEQTSYNLNYQDYNTGNKNVAGYSYGQPHAPRTIVDQPNLANCCDADNDPRVKTKTFDYDANGNQTKISSKICTSPTPDVLRENLWDEENRLRAIDLNPEANTVHPIAIYTYDAGGERIIKQNATSVAIYENALQVGTDIKNDFMLYPSGMLVARPAGDGTGALSYTKHYFAGSQRVSSKIGTTTNLGKFLQEWTLIENTSGGAPINLVSTSHDQLTKAETGVVKIYDAFNIDFVPTFNSNNAFLPVSAFTGTTAEIEQFWFHPDHLGSSNYITNFVGEVSQHMEYFAFGESFVEEHKNSNNSPYKFNGKELDEESGYTYYGARYLDMRYSTWISVDPLMYDGTFWEGEGNSVGIFDAKNLSIYTYAFNNPLNVTDPDGRDIVIRGKNNSKIVIKTSLISFEANMSSGALAMDFRGQHILKGNDALHFALDVVGVFDPSGTADAINGSLYLNEGNYLDAALSGVGLLAYVGDVAKLKRLWKGYDKIKDMLKLKPCGCFIAGTQVLTEEGYKNIEEIQKGDIVWAFDDKTGDLQPKKVTETYTLEFSQIFKLYIGDEIVEVTHEHPFFIGGKWLKADELKVGDFVTLYDGTAKRIDKIDFISNGKFKVYTFEVEDYHSYFVGKSKILVHNGNPCKVIFGSNMMGKFKKHSAEMIAAARKNGITLPKGLSNSNTLKAYQDYIQAVVKGGDSFVSEYMTMGDVIWSKMGDSIVIRKLSGEFVTHLTTATKQGKETLKHYNNVVSKSQKAVPITK